VVLVGGLGEEDISVWRVGVVDDRDEKDAE